MAKEKKVPRKRAAPLRSRRRQTRAGRIQSTAEERTTGWTKIGPGGRIVIPAPMRKALGIGNGDRVQLQVVDGELRIVPQEVALRRVQEFVAKYVPKGVSLVDELIEERRREAELEERSD
jgi:AbrB family looped-hinge helix DNA binding protein